MRSWSISRPDSSGTSAASAVSWVTRGWLVMTILLSRRSGPDEDQGVIVVQIIGGSRQPGRHVGIGTMAPENADGLRHQAPGSGLGPAAEDLGSTTRTTTFSAGTRNGNASEAARALSRLAFQHSMTVLPGFERTPICGTTRVGRPAERATVSGRSVGVSDTASGSVWPTTSRSA